MGDYLEVWVGLMVSAAMVAIPLLSLRLYRGRIGDRCLPCCLLVPLWGAVLGLFVLVGAIVSYYAQ